MNELRRISYLKISINNKMNRALALPYDRSRRIRTFLVVFKTSIVDTRSDVLILSSLQFS